MKLPPGSSRAQIDARRLSRLVDTLSANARAVKSRWREAPIDRFRAPPRLTPAGAGCCRGCGRQSSRSGHSAGSAACRTCSSGRAGGRSARGLRRGLGRSRSPGRRRRLGPGARLADRSHDEERGAPRDRACPVRSLHVRSLPAEEAGLRNPAARAQRGSLPCTTLPARSAPQATARSTASGHPRRTWKNSSTSGSCTDRTGRSPSSRAAHSRRLITCQPKGDFTRWYGATPISPTWSRNETSLKCSA